MSSTHPVPSPLPRYYTNATTGSSSTATTGTSRRRTAAMASALIPRSRRRSINSRIAVIFQPTAAGVLPVCLSVCPSAGPFAARPTWHSARRLPTVFLVLSAAWPSRRQYSKQSFDSSAIYSYLFRRCHRRGRLLLLVVVARLLIVESVCKHVLRASAECVIHADTSSALRRINIARCHLLATVFVVHICIPCCELI